MTINNSSYSFKCVRIIVPLIRTWWNLLPGTYNEHFETEGAQLPSEASNEPVPHWSHKQIGARKEGHRRFEGRLIVFSRN